MLTFGDNLKRIRKAHSMNQKALGDAIGVGQTTIANYEKGVRFPTGEILKQIGEILNVSIDELMNHSVIYEDVDREQFDLEAYLEAFIEDLIDGREQEAIHKIWQLNPDEDSIVMIYIQVLSKAMIEIGTLWEKGIINVATEHHASQIVHRIISMLSTIPARANKGSMSALCISMNAEPHTIGLRMVSEYMNLRGIISYYIGTSVPTESLIEKLCEKRIDILALSATMPYHLDAMYNLIAVIRLDQRLKHLKIIAGGQAFTYENDYEVIEGLDCVCKDLDAIGSWLESNT